MIKLVVLTVLLGLSVADYCDAKCDTCDGGICSKCKQNAAKTVYGSCACKSFWAGPECTVYMGTCSPKCFGCSGPDDAHCDHCVIHASPNSEGVCVCDQGWTGDHCGYEDTFSGLCDPKCAGGCNGPLPSDCNSCIKNSYKAANGECTCKTYFYGEDCGHTDNPRAGCDPRCYGCTGTTNFDCISCAKHATASSYGSCECDSYWTGDDCGTSTLFGGICDKKCDGCSGPTAFECIQCATNAHENDFGQCICNDYYYGDDCTSFKQEAGYNSICDAKCLGGCKGGTAYDCYACVNHATRDADGQCKCDSFWTGDDCTINTYAYAKTDTCHSACRGCTGPTEFDCVECVEHASKDMYGKCACSPYWYGADCSTHSLNNRGCDAKCSDCTGPTAYDCISCVSGAERNMYGACECKPHQSGDDCSTGKSITCDPKCGREGCNGPTVSDCVSCADHATQNKYGACVCDYGWSGQDCGLYMADHSDVYYDVCSSKCKGCRGPRASDCLACVDNAHRDDYGVCVCDEVWTGDDCSVGNKAYGGSCSPRCASDYGCSGPTPKDCVVCTSNAAVNGSGECVCNTNYDGEDCSLRLDTPFGNTTYNFEARGAHADYMDDTGFVDSSYTRSPYQDYRGDSNYSNGITYSTYSGASATGGSYSATGATHENSYDNSFYSNNNYNSNNRNGYGNTYGYSGYSSGDSYVYHDDNQYANYGGYFPCDSRCYGGCVGPTNRDCIACVNHSSKDYYGACVCDDGWQGDECKTGLPNGCDPKCNGCTGPDANDCQQCVEHGTRNMYGYCTCDPNWGAQDCGVWLGPCSPRCDGGCTGPEACHCNVCVRNAYIDQNGYCSCTPYWSGPDCATYSGPCDLRCYGCSGPDSSDCVECVPHASKDINGTCVCDDSWGGDDCSDYIGVCHPTCNGCHGSEAHDCEYCVANAGFNSYGYCQCEANWTGDNCSRYTGECAHTCYLAYGCTGGRADDCVYCNDHAHRNDLNECVCDDYWGGEQCYDYSGPCDPCCPDGCTGPSNRECLDSGVGVNSMIDFQGRCSCQDGWTGDDCTFYIGACHDSCLACFGPTQMDCTDCPDNSFWQLNVGCTCEENYSGYHCRVYSGNCDIKCQNGCYGPYDTDCIECDTNATWDFEKLECICLDQWWEPDCSCFADDCCLTCGGDYVADLASCNTDCPSGGSAYDCEICTQNAFRDRDGACRCLPDYSQGDDTCSDDCSTYSGMCDWHCRTCVGPSQDECVDCFPHATFGANGCECDLNYGGQDCEVYYGVCAPTCEGCTGPSAADCIDCREFATRGTDGACACLEDPIYGGNENCTDIDQAFCHEACLFQVSEITCWGAAPYQCYKCTEHAHRDLNGDCVCDDDYSGEADCTLYNGQCSEKCLGCTGPYHTDCTTCVGNATRGDEGCACDDGWGGNDCQEWLGECPCECISCNSDQVCEGGCVDNAIWSEDDDICVCEADWQADCCQTHTGQCAPTCSIGDTCARGPGPESCDECILNAHRNSRGECVCDEYWGAADCSRYSGPCDCRCAGTCSGPNNDDCDDCKDHARDVDGFCVCEDFWGNDCCTEYTGACNCKCDTCFGPTEADCNACTLNSSRLVSTEQCTCDKDWTADACCGVFSGTCAPTCKRFGGDPADDCFDIHAHDCIECVENAYRDVDGSCVCFEDWSDEQDCTLYNGICDCHCLNGCTGPTANDCIDCAINAEQNADLTCVCQDGWTGNCCEVFKGECNDLCATCAGHPELHCVDCTENAHHDLTAGENQGECVCDPCWEGPDCKTIKTECCSCKCGSLNDTDLECYALGDSGCTFCAANAYRNEVGTCECHVDWTGEGDCCTEYRGECACGCEACSGPNTNQCTSCPGQEEGRAELVGSDCSCINGWTGCRCDQWAGECHKLCIGCFGPTEWDCIECSPNSAMSKGNGKCECLSGWGGDCCLTKLHDCHPSCGNNEVGEACCVVDGQAGAHECTCCNDGYYLSAVDSGFCYPCDDNCRTCSSPQGPTDCLSCYDGFYLSVDDTTGLGSCLECHPCCGTCDGPTSNECLSCNAGASIPEGLVDGDDRYCQCALGYLDLCSCSCTDRCATGIAPNEYGQCPSTSSDLAITFDFSQPAELPNLVEGSLICADWCHPHLPMPNSTRGGYFDGQKTSLLINNFIMNGTFTVNIGARVLNNDVSLWSAQVNMMTNNRDNDTRDESKYDYLNQKYIIDFFITKCNGIVLDFGPDRFKSTMGHTYEGGWASFTVCATKHGIPGDTRTDIDVYLNGDQILNVDGATEFSNWVLVHDEEPNFHIGSYKGLLYHVDGFINYFEYTPDSCIASNFVAGSDCEWWQFGDADCTNCHSTCQRGCEDEKECTLSCHPSCKNCTGPTADDCVDCWCDAHRTHPELQSSCCECDLGSMGSPDNCRPVCIDGCDVCSGNGQYDCELCGTDYQLADATHVTPGSCEACIDEVCDNYYADCDVKSHRKPCDACTCGDNQWYDDDQNRCRHCPNNCSDCQDADEFGMHCKQCAPGYLFAPGADICLNFCPTGFKEISGQPECLGKDNTGLVAYAKFTFENSISRSWQYSDMKSFDSYTYNWMVKFFGGASELTIQKDDPYAFDDRGLYFDGKYDYLTVKMLTLHNTFTLSAWIKPHGSGSLYSSVRNYGGDIEHSFNWGISERRLEFEDKSHHYYFRTENPSVTDLEWQNVAMTAEWRQQHMQTNIAFYTNNVLQDCQFYDHIIRDYPDYINTHFVGVNERKETLVNFYHGFMYEFYAHNDVQTDQYAFAHMGITTSCGGGDCSVCPTSLEECLGTCYWNQYHDGAECARCPPWCRDGCQSNGSC